jgi:CMP-N,N'-diacetyllegionaminic acid synthase
MGGALGGKKMSSIAFIPARSGSKGIPNKNIKLLCEKPLITYTLSSAFKSTVDLIVVSTDSDRIFSICEKYVAESFPEDKGRLVYHKRPRSLSTDTSTIKCAIKNFFLHEQVTKEDIVCVLQPTSPIRKCQHINTMLGMIDNKYKSAISVTTPSQKPQEMLVKRKGKYEFLMPEGKGSQRQEYEETIYINGSIYCFSLGYYLKDLEGKFSTRYFKMDARHSVDIDEPEDLILAEHFLRSEGWALCAK